VDGVVFVADSQIERMEANLESAENLRTNLAEQGYDLDRIPYVVQYNKRDLPNIASVEELRRLLNPRTVPEYQAVAPTGVGVFDTLKAVAKLVLTELKRGG
jgi:signal recognition particle receptor subunit beta